MEQIGVNEFCSELHCIQRLCFECAIHAITVNNNAPIYDIWSIQNKCKTWRNPNQHQQTTKCYLFDGMATQFRTKTLRHEFCPVIGDHYTVNGKPNQTWKINKIIIEIEIIQWERDSCPYFGNMMWSEQHRRRTRTTEWEERDTYWVSNVQYFDEWLTVS